MGFLSGGNPPKPQPRNLLREGAKTLSAYEALAPRVFALQDRYSTQYAGTAARAFRDTAPITAQTLNDLATQQRSSDLGDLNQLGSGYVSAANAIDPGSRRLLDELQSSALSNLSYGQNLTPAQTNQLRQSYMANASARGFAPGGGDAAAGALAELAAGNQLYQQRQDDAFRALGAGRDYTAGALAPLFRGNDSIGVAGYGASQGQSPFGSPFGDPYAADVYNTNYNAMWANRIGAQNRRAALNAATISAVGQMGAAALSPGGCWVAREVYGDWNPRWVLFRHYLRTKAPRLAWWAYCRWGERLAQWLAPRPKVKAWLRRWMDRRIEHAL